MLLNKIPKVYLRDMNLRSPPVVSVFLEKMQWINNHFHNQNQKETLNNNFLVSGTL